MPNKYLTEIPNKKIVFFFCPTQRFFLVLFCCSWLAWCCGFLLLFCWIFCGLIGAVFMGLDLIAFRVWAMWTKYVYFTCLADTFPNSPRGNIYYFLFGAWSVSIFVCPESLWLFLVRLPLYFLETICFLFGLVYYFSLLCVTLAWWVASGQGAEWHVNQNQSKCSRFRAR